MTTKNRLPPHLQLEADMEKLIKSVHKGQITEQNLYDLMFCGYRMYKSGSPENMPVEMVKDTIKRSLLRAVFRVGE